MQPLSLPSLPACLLRDEIALPERYAPAAWARGLVAEWASEEKLLAASAYPTQSVLIEGPSGVGKTTAARWIGRALDLPVVSLVLSATIDSYMGATSKNLDAALVYAMQTRCVLVLDELDAVSASRSAKGNDVGEIWRVTNAFIQSLDRWHGEARRSLLIGTTNMADSIDVAIRRRFELEATAELPTCADLSAIAGVLLPEGMCSGWTHADMRRAVLLAKRRSVLDGLLYKTALLRAIEGC